MNGLARWIRRTPCASPDAPPVMWAVIAIEVPLVMG
jgi:hypothetical protein